MSFGKMNTTISIVAPTRVKDDQGFSSVEDSLVLTTRAYREGRHGSRRWANLSAFTEATDLFRFRASPGVCIREGSVVVAGEERFDVISVEDVKGRGMYLELLAKKVVTQGG